MENSYVILPLYCLVVAALYTSILLKLRQWDSAHRPAFVLIRGRVKDMVVPHIIDNNKNLPLPLFYGKHLQ